MATSSPVKIRLDQCLADKGLAQSRSRARDLITRGCVRVNGQLVKKAGQSVSSESHIEIDDADNQYVSRAALKLAGALDASGFAVEGAHALDLGASTGGFTQVLLQNKAAHVVALDVGHGQIVQSLADDPRVTVMEGFNARALTVQDLPYRPDFIVSDMSFVSLKLAATPALQLSAPRARAILLVKPQFEVGRQFVGKGGVVNDKTAIQSLLDEFPSWLESLPGWHCHRLIASPISGSDGNQEYLLCGERHA